MSDLPVGWVWATVEEVGDVSEQAVLTGPFGSKLKTSDFQADGVPVLTIGCLTEAGLALAKANYISKEKASELARYVVRAGDMLFSRMASVGKACMVTKRHSGAIFNYHLMSLRLSRQTYDTRLFMYFVRGAPSVAEYLRKVNHGATRDGINTKQLLAMPLLVPPLNEQRRIVQAIEALQAKAKAAKAALDAIPPLLETFRQSVLAAAFRGDLTREWRAQHPDVEPASVLLERIRAERRVRWIEAAAEKGRERAQAQAEKKGKDWSAADDAAALERERVKATKKYVAPAPVDAEAAGLPELPTGWCWARAEEIVEPGANIVYGIVQPGPPQADGVPYVRGKDIQGDDIVIEQLWRTTAAIAASYSRSEIRTGDVLLCIIRHLKVAIVPAALNGGNLSRTTARLRPSLAITTKYLAWCLRSPHCQSWLKSNYRGGTSMPKVNIGDALRLPIPLSPRVEQDAIVLALEPSLRIVEERKEELAAAYKAIDVLNQSILAKAFRGELVPQDPNDEPASVLLERIRAERAAAEASKPKKTRRKRAPNKAAKAPKQAALPGMMAD